MYIYISLYSSLYAIIPSFTILITNLCPACIQSLSKVISDCPFLPILSAVSSTTNSGDTIDLEKEGAANLKRLSIASKPLLIDCQLTDDFIGQLVSAKNCVDINYFPG